MCHHVGSRVPVVSLKLLHLGSRKPRVHVAVPCRAGRALLTSGWPPRQASSMSVRLLVLVLALAGACCCGRAQQVTIRCGGCPSPCESVHGGPLTTPCPLCCRCRLAAVQAAQPPCSPKRRFRTCGLPWLVYRAALRTLELWLLGPWLLVPWLLAPRPLTLRPLVSRPLALWPRPRCRHPRSPRRSRSPVGSAEQHEPARRSP